MILFRKSFWRKRSLRADGQVSSDDGTRTPLTMPNHRLIKGSTLRLILRQSEISREEFLEAYEEC